MINWKLENTDKEKRGEFMYILIMSIVVVLLYLVYALWVHVKSSVLPVQRLKNDENSINCIQMEKYFSF